MSAQPLSVPEATLPPGEQSAVARIAQLQEMIQRADAAASGTVVTSSGGTTAGGEAGSFAAALQSATAQTASYMPSTAGSGSTPYDAMVEAAAERNGLEPALLHGLIQQESGFDPSSQSSAGAMGLTQLMPGTASSLGVSNPLDPAESIEGGARYLAEMMARFGGNPSEALAAYNAGPGAVTQYGGVPPYAETQSYVQKVLGYAESYRQEHAAPAANGSIV